MDTQTQTQTNVSVIRVFVKKNRIEIIKQWFSNLRFDKEHFTIWKYTMLKNLGLLCEGVVGLVTLGIAKTDFSLTPNKRLAVALAIARNKMEMEKQEKDKEDEKKLHPLAGLSPDEKAKKFMEAMSNKKHTDEFGNQV